MSTPNSPAAPPTRREFPHFQQVQTRWMDNDMYGHVNNVVHYAWFDSVITEYMIRECGLDIHSPQSLAVFAVETGCRFHRSLTYPESIDVGLRIGQLGTSSTRFEVALFRQGEDKAAASGYFTLVFVDRASNKPTPIPQPMRVGLQRLMGP